MADLMRKPRAGQLLDSNSFTEIMDSYLEVGLRSYDSPSQFTVNRGILLANHHKAVVARMRVPYAPYYDTKFILKHFKTWETAQAPIEQVELEAASLHHAAEAFRRNNNISRVPRVYAIEAIQDVVTMECIHGRGVRDSPQVWWPKERMIRFVRQMAVARLAIMTQVEDRLGVPRHVPYGGRVGPYCRSVWWDNDKHRFWNEMDRGPFPNTHELILASLQRDLLLTRWMSDTGLPLPERSYFRRFTDVIWYLEQTIANIQMVPRPTDRQIFSLNHNDLQRGFNAMLRGSKLVALIDWETASYDPLSTCVSDLANATDYNPKVWREHAGPNGESFYRLPYRLAADPTQARLQYSTAIGAENKPFPDWELIESHGGPLGEGDFCGDHYPEDISSGEDESMVDAAEMHCDSDADAGEACVIPRGSTVDDENEWLRTGERAPPIGHTWYYEPVYALMKEFIHHHHGAGVGPDGEWGRLPEEYSRPLAEWDDPLFWSVTRSHFDGRHEQLINRQTADVVAAKASRGKRRKQPGRQRRVPTLIDNIYEATVVGAEFASESELSSTRIAFLRRDLPPRRTRPKSPPNSQFVPLRAPAISLARGPPFLDQQPEEVPPSDDARVTGVRDSILENVMREFSIRPGGRAEL